MKTECPVRRQERGVWEPNKILLLKTGIEHFTLIEMKKELKPKAYQQIGELMISKCS
jgi:hypothetical protein